MPVSSSLIVSSGVTFGACATSALETTGRITVPSPYSVYDGSDLRLNSTGTKPPPVLTRSTMSVGPVACSMAPACEAGGAVLEPAGESVSAPPQPAATRAPSGGDHDEGAGGEGCACRCDDSRDVGSVPGRAHVVPVRCGAGAIEGACGEYSLSV